MALFLSLLLSLWFYCMILISMVWSMNGFVKWLLRVSCDGLSHILKGNLNHNGGPEMDGNEMSKMHIPLTVSHGSIMGGGSRAGLFRTPISGGVQSATSAHGLPRPPLAVRNLMEQVKNYLILKCNCCH